MSFLPTTYNKIPTNSDYMKLQDGENSFRVLSSAVVGYEYWNTENKPVRSREGWDYIPDDCKQEKDGKYKVNHFWAFVVWNYEEKRVQLLEITRKQIMKQLKALVDNTRWGDPKKYDITINKSGTGFDTEYVVQGNPPISEPDPKIAEAYLKKQVNLEALFEGGDPFLVVAKKATPAEIVAEASKGKFQPKPMPEAVEAEQIDVNDIPTEA